MTAEAQTAVNFSGKDVIKASLVAAGSFGLIFVAATGVIVVLVQSGNSFRIQESFGFFMAMAFAEAFSLLLGAWYPIWRKSADAIEMLGFRPMSLKWLGIAAFATVAVIVLQTALSASEFEVDFGGGDSVSMIVGDDPTFMRFILAFFAIAVAAPLAEEIFFRGVLFGWASQRWGFIGPAIATSLFFGLLHQQYTALGLLLIGLIGFVAAALYYFSRSLWTAVSYHAMNNGIAVILMFWFPENV